MSLNTNIGIWYEIARPHYPLLTDIELTALSMKAAGYWYTQVNDGGGLAKLFDQYVMLKTLNGMGAKEEE